MGAGRWLGGLIMVWKGLHALRVLSGPRAIAMVRLVAEDGALKTSIGDTADKDY
jgi:hypothetical protein